MKLETKILGLAAGLLASSASHSMGAPSASPKPQRGIHGTQLYGKFLGAGHSVEFYEFSPGEVAIRESKSADDGKPVFMDGIGAFGTLADVYARLNPGVKTVPQHIRVADRRAAVKRSEALRRGLSAPPPPETDFLRDAPVTASASAPNCSGDFYGDAWGANWFLNNYCNAGQFRWCDATNWGYAYSGWHTVHWASWRQMEGDFNERGHISCEAYKQHWYGDSLKTLVVDYDVLPRHVEVWYTSDIDTTYQWYANSICGHLHVAFLRNP
jgi:hypothetical protein